MHLVCPNAAITERPISLGRIEERHPLPDLRLISGVMNEGEAVGIPVIQAAKEAAAGDATVILDSSPGTACPVIETVKGSDVCVLVTEATPFGLHEPEAGGRGSSPSRGAGLRRIQPARGGL